MDHQIALHQQTPGPPKGRLLFLLSLMTWAGAQLCDIYKMPLAAGMAALSSLALMVGSVLKEEGTWMRRVGVLLIRVLFWVSFIAVTAYATGNFSKD